MRDSEKKIVCFDLCNTISWRQITKKSVSSTLWSCLLHEILHLLHETCWVDSTLFICTVRLNAVYSTYCSGSDHALFSVGCLEPNRSSVSWGHDWTDWPELKTFEWRTSGLMLDPLFFFISRLNNAYSPLLINLQIN